MTFRQKIVDVFKDKDWKIVQPRFGEAIFYRVGANNAAVHSEPKLASGGSLSTSYLAQKQK
jgi:hypothetical protein